MPAKVSTLSKSFLAEWALERPQSSVLTEMISKVTAFLEYTSTMRIFALKVKLNPLSFWILDSNCLMPLLRNPLKCFMFVSS
jgi:hypothetical protein